MANDNDAGRSGTSDGVQIGVPMPEGLHLDAAVGAQSGATTVRDNDDVPPTTTLSRATAGLVAKQLLGEGGMGSVYLVHEPELGRDVATKVLSEALASDEHYRKAFVAEARVSAQLQHPAIVPVHSIACTPDGSLSFTMQVVQGQNMRDWMRSDHYPIGSRERLEQGLEIFMKVCDALAFAHSRRILHCDVKPENVMVGDYGRVYLMDWGLARSLDSDERPGVAGTPAYMSPEQARNERLDERSDVFGLGAILFELIAGEPPYGRASSETCLARAASGRISDIMQLVRHMGVSRRVCRIAAKAVAVDPSDRYQTVSELREAAHQFLRSGLHLPRQAYARGTLIVREGETEDTAYMIVSGRCRVFRSHGDQQKTLRELGPGDIFGELSLLLNTARTASVIVEEECTVLVIDRNTLESSGAMEGWTAELLRALATRFRQTEARLED
jgi:serine/threonine-protein kinase